MIENELEEDKELTREKALKVLQKAMEITYYRDCGAADEYTISFIEKDENSFLKTEKIVGVWDIADKNNQYF
jgi:20S proteasome alpha/beta subunit